MYDLFVVDRDYTDTVTVDGVDHEEIRSTRYIDLTEDLMDYISRLPELYYFTSVGAE